MVTMQRNGEELRELADRPTGALQTKCQSLLLHTTVSVKLIGVEQLAGCGTKVIARAERPLRMRKVRLGSGAEMVLAFVVPPRKIDSRETVATMTRLELLRMVVKTETAGVVISAEAPRSSWAGIERERIPAILGEAAKLQ
jgi:hypothetical protein